MIQKDFWGWHKEKEGAHNMRQRPFFRERDVWWGLLGVNIGFEQDGGKKFLRPILVIKKFSGGVCWCVPLTKKRKTGKYYTDIVLLGIPRTVVLSQLKLIDSKRLHHKLGVVSDEDFLFVKTKLTQFLA